MTEVDVSGLMNNLKSSLKNSAKDFPEKFKSLP